jgi:hypothetical protein
MGIVMIIIYCLIAIIFSTMAVEVLRERLKVLKMLAKILCITLSIIQGILWPITLAVSIGIAIAHVVKRQDNRA